MSIDYFAYGANLDVPAMQARCPGAIPVRTGVLHGHRLVAMREGWLSVTPDPGFEVEGLLWTLQEHHFEPLDAYEGVADGLYVRRRLAITIGDGTTTDALVYIGTNDGPGRLNADYADRVERAAAVALGSDAAGHIRSLGPETGTGA